MPLCAMCEQPVEQWVPHPERDKRSALCAALDVIGSDLTLHSCPHCHCNDRERHIWLYINAVGILEDSLEQPILHIAPEPNIERKLRAIARADYFGGDLTPRDPLHLRLDVEQLDQPTGRFHLIICNHVLEHVADPHRAIRELARCLADDGWLIAQTPYSPLLSDTMEFCSPATTDAAELFFGQKDHVRLFGANIAEHFVAAGLKGGLYPHDAILPGIDAVTCGCNAREPFFVFSKSRWLTSRG